MKTLKLFTVVMALIGLSGCIAIGSRGAPGPQGAQGPQGSTGSSEKIIVVPERRY